MSRQFRTDIVAALPKVRRFAYSLTGNMADADDLLQSACERALRNEASFQPGTRMESWMYRIVQNLWIDECRRRRVRGTAVDPEDAGLSDGGSAARGTEDRMTLEQVRAAMANLPEAQRAVLALVAVEGLSYRETSEILEIPVGTVMSRLSRARDALMRHTSEIGRVSA